MECDQGFLGSFKDSLLKTSSMLDAGIRRLFQGGRKVDQETLKELLHLLISTDMGHESATFFTQKIAEMQFREPSYEQVREKLAGEMEAFLARVSVPISIDHNPQVIMLCGVNGSGKTTTAAKLARKFQREGKSVLIGACDTFRAAAVSQLKIWAERISCPIVAGEPGADAASIAYKAVDQAICNKIDVVLIDTAGRLHNHKNLMEELAKVRRVVSRHSGEAPHNTIVVIDATVGQNAFLQVEVFSSFVDVNGIILTKLDGTAKGGIVLRITQKYGINLHAVGVGEGIDDLRDFSAREFSRSLLEI
ncbi:signal recognition particle-docking protein FtsY [Anaplasma capra]|uniref:signal recognition particle-docking protein FtsY n=1 Tax=Anaplasma capra TaxID=1562740 RepID=UPI0021D5DD44|nr:signal recognition particle-docking protein FtsY [Anaplasma capra]MCU7611311.1 signal recognition particle-docking protein FtsY [Anaplasma capra]MCU7612736.1 signal recognition particle-docking protein FtsY [Anaplasma capra]